MTWNPAESARLAVGAVPPTDAAVRFGAETVSREAAKRAFEAAWELTDERGFPSERGWQRLELLAQHQRNMSAADWIVCTEAEERTIVAHMRAAQHADRIAASATTTGPGGDLNQWQREAARRVQEANANRDGALRGVPRA